MACGSLRDTATVDQSGILDMPGKDQSDPHSGALMTTEPLEQGNLSSTVMSTLCFKVTK